MIIQPGRQKLKNKNLRKEYFNYIISPKKTLRVYYEFIKSKNN